ncbi:hypothetical protein ACH3XW_25710 [Acanthocheilonema viteae]
MLATMLLLYTCIRNRYETQQYAVVNSESLIEKRTEKRDVVPSIRLLINKKSLFKLFAIIKLERKKTNQLMPHWL